VPPDSEFDPAVDIVATQAVIDRGIGRARLLVKWTKRQVLKHALDAHEPAPPNPAEPPAIKF